MFLQALLSTRETQKGLFTVMPLQVYFPPEKRRKAVYSNAFTSFTFHPRNAERLFTVMPLQALLSTREIHKGCLQ